MEFDDFLKNNARGVDFEQMKKVYLNCYRKIEPLDETNIAYYRSVRSVLALIDGARRHVISGIRK